MSIVATVAHLNKSSAVAEMGDGGHNRHGPKRGGAVPLSRELGPRLVQCGLGRGLLPSQVASSSIQPFCHNRHGPKIGWEWVCPFLGLAGSPSNTKSHRTRPTSIPSGILVIQPFGQNGHWPKNRGSAALGEGELGPHLIQCRVGGVLPL